MDITRANLDAMFQSYSTAFSGGLTRNLGEDISFLFFDAPSTSAANLYGWLDLVPGFREWVGERVRNNVSSQRFTVTNRSFEATAAIGRNDILDDQFGIYTPMIRMQGESWPVKLRETVMEVLTGNPLTYTGANLFGTHKLTDKVSITNKTTNALTKANFEAAILAASAWKLADGSLAKPRFTHLIVGEKLRGTAHGIVVADKIGTVVQNVAGTENVGGVTTDNPNKGKCQLVVLEELAGDYDDYWFLVDASKVIKPIVRQIRETPMPKMDTDPIRVDRDGKVDFLATGRAAAAPTLPWLVYGGIL